MSVAQRIVVLCGLVGILHSSMVPPVQQAAGAVCRYHEFMGRTWPYAREYGVVGADIVALLSEYGIIASLTGAIYLGLGFLAKGSEDQS